MAYERNNRSTGGRYSGGRGASSRGGSDAHRHAGDTRARAASAYSRAVEHSKTSVHGHGSEYAHTASSDRETYRGKHYSARGGRHSASSRYGRDSYTSSRSGHAHERDDRSGSNAHRHDEGRRLAGGRGLKPYVAALVAVVVIIAIVVIANPFKAVNTIADKQGTSMNATNSAAYDSSADDALPTPIIAESNGVQLHSAVAANDLTEILIHNASYAYAAPLTTKLTEATNTEVMANHGTGRNADEQPTGDKWMTGEFIRCFRSTNAGPKMSAIDCGGKEGTTVYSPVTGKVVLVKQYKLYEKYDDYQIHIQPDGHPELDVVLIHLTDVSVKAGDQVTAGESKMAKIRDVYALIGEEMQLKQYTAEGDNGNHTHIQVNLANDPSYHGLDDLKQGTAASGASAS